MTAEVDVRPSRHGPDAETYKAVLARHAAGVVVVTGRAGSGPVGLTATSFTSVSLHPPLVAFYVARTSTTWPLLRAAPTFAVNILNGGQSEVAARFARPDTDRFAPPTRWRTDSGGLPLLDDAAAHLVCRWHTVSPVGDHWLVVGRVTGAEAGEAETPLLYHRGRFGGFHPID
ncbi:MAG TPA: flavin reductase family protein [Streptosporangiaceae bacterium]|jgi:flavin reductase (DIM6/NTAB) family NADH-FMN oxidoreductase RutF